MRAGGMIGRHFSEPASGPVGRRTWNWKCPQPLIVPNTRP